MLKAIIFDFDKTLVNLGDFVDWEAARQELREFYGKNGADEKVIKNMTSFEMMEKFGDKPKASGILERYEAKGVAKSSPMEGAEEILKWVKANGLLVGIVSLNPRGIIEKCFTMHGLLAYVDAIVGRDDVKHHKPDSDHTDACLSLLHVTRNEAVIIGDTTYDIKAARNTGMVSIGVCTGFSTREELKNAGADYLAANLGEAKTLIGKLRKRD